MKLHSVLLLAMIAIPGLEASAILDATGETTALLHTGDSLNFELFGGSFGLNARAFGLQSDPTEISFALVSAPTMWAGSFSGALGSSSGAVNFSGLTFHPGTFSGAGYQGGVSTLQGYLHLSPQLSREFSGGGPVVLTLRNDGPDLVLGLNPYFLRQDLYVSLYGGRLSVGATGGSVSVASASPALSAAPEPDSLWLFWGAGALLCGFSVALGRVPGRPK